MNLSGAHSDLSNSELDALYADVYQSYVAATGANKITWSHALSELTVEIVNRLTGPLEFVSGIFGRTKFPQYDAIQAKDASLRGFRQAVMSRESVAENVPSEIGWGVSGAALIGLAALAVVVAVKSK